MLFVVFSAGIFFSCQQSQEVQEEIVGAATPLDQPPAWSKDVVWYQIFPERFRNGDPNNDPTPVDMEGSYPGFIPEDWAITPWTHDWYKPDPFFEHLEGKVDMAGYSIRHFSQLSRSRRYGGDLKGVMDKMDYLEDLGVTAVYFNPLNDAPSDHKYDARSWRHIDRNFGPDPVRDAEMMDAENPADPSTWQWTTADSMFLAVVDAFHQRGIRVIMDYSFNHTGVAFWAWEDILENQSDSKFKDWYWVNSFDNPQTPENEFDYHGWFGVKDLPEIQETEYADHSQKVVAFEGDLKDVAVKDHIFSVVKRWLDPNGDGDPSDGVDGFRLDVAVEMPLGFWRDFRKHVRSINTETYLVGEVWWEQWPDDLMDPAPFLEGDIFDAVMHYRWYKPTRHFFAQAPDKIAVSEYVQRLEVLQEGIRPQSTQALMNVAASHDSPRLATSLFNSEGKYKVGTEPFNNAGYKIYRPDETTRQTQRMVLVQQFTYLGAPHIWAGDEMGMWGADMGDTRKPLIWPDYEFDNEVVHPLDMKRTVDEVRFDNELFDFYKKLIAIRKQNPVLVDGQLEFILADDENEILAYSRFDEETEIIAVFNTSLEEREVQLPAKFDGEYADPLWGKDIIHGEKELSLNLPARTGTIIQLVQ